MPYSPILSASEYPARALSPFQLKELLLTGAGPGIGIVAEPRGKIALKIDGYLYQDHEKRLGQDQKPAG